jgi:membrane protein
MSRISRLFKDVLSGWLEADAFSLAAALAYYAIFSIAPLLLLSIHLASFFLDRAAAVEGLTNELINVIGPTGSDAIRQMLDAAATAQPQGWPGLIGLGVLLFAATGFVGSLQDALDKVWEAPPRPSGLWAFIRTKLFSFSLILAAAFLLLVSLVLSTVMTAVGGRITGVIGLPEGIVELIVATANFLLAALIFAAIFKYVPSVFVTWQAAVAGGVFTAVLFALGRFALAWYLGREAEGSAYGAATSLVLLLVWVYYSAQILFLGAQFSQSFQNEGIAQASEEGAFAVARSPAPATSDDDIVAMVAAVLGLGFLLGAIAMQRPHSRSRASQPGLLQRASNLFALTRSLVR